MNELRSFKDYCYSNPDVTIELEWEDGYKNKQKLGGSFIYQGERKHEGRRPIILRVFNAPHLENDIGFSIQFGKMLHPNKKQLIEFREDR